MVTKINCLMQLLTNLFNINLKYSKDRSTFDTMQYLWYKKIDGIEKLDIFIELQVILENLDI